MSLGGDSPKSVTKFTIPDEKPAKARPGVDGVSQEVRDANAKAKNDEYKAADADAKELEATARKGRESAHKVKAEKNKLKDLACETRPGGKLLCLRGLGSGY